MVNDCRGAYLPSTIKCGFYSDEKVLFSEYKSDIKLPIFKSSFNKNVEVRILSIRDLRLKKR